MTSGDPSSKLKPGYDIVFTVSDYFDGPVYGIANFQRKPHFYTRVFDEATDEYSDFYLLTPIDEEAFAVAMEDWAIWTRWKAAFHAGKTDLSSHPTLPQDRSRHDELRLILDKTLVTDPIRSEKRIGKVEGLGHSELPKGVIRQLQVKWNEP